MVPGQLLAAIRDAAREQAGPVARFLSDLVRIRSLSGEEGAVIARIAREMRDAGLDDVRVDAFGNVSGGLGRSGPLLAFDAHVDTVDVGNRDAWEGDPFAGEVRDGCVWGRGASDQKAGMAAAIFAARVLRNLGVETPFRFLAVGSVQEEDCDGLCWQYLLREKVIVPDCVVITEPTCCEVYRGHRGRMEIAVSVEGLSAHGSAPERGINAIYRMADILKELEVLNDRLTAHPFLGKGSLTVSEIRSGSPSLCAVADHARIHVDRRLTLGETRDSALREIESLPSVQRYGGRVEVLRYDRPTHTGYVLPAEKYYPCWLFEEDHPAVRAACRTWEALFEAPCRPGRWLFSTNGVATAGMFGVPTVGFGPGDERFAHAPNERCEIEHLVRAVAFYAAFGFFWCEAAPPRGHGGAT